MFKPEKYANVMRPLWCRWVVFSWMAFIASCGTYVEDSVGLQRVLNEAGANKEELVKVITHYSAEEKDSLKLIAANFLIENMYKHEMVSDSAYDGYASRITRKVMPISTPDLNNLWNTKYDVKKRKTAETIKAVDLIADIDEAFVIREQSRWKDSIDWEVFLSHILPFKVDEEMFIVHWRKTLYNKYKYLLDNTDSPKEAFVRVKTFIRSQSREAKSNFSKNIDPLTMDYLRRGSCAQLDIYTIAVLRALHIPAAYDFIESWGNYSKVGHSWRRI